MKKSISGFVAIIMGIILSSMSSFSIAHAATPNCNFTRDLSVGSGGLDVLCLQQYLNSAGFIIASWGSGSLGNETNYFGTATEAAVIKWQIAYGISPASGYFGTVSRAKYQAIIGLPLFMSATNQSSAGTNLPLRTPISTPVAPAPQITSISPDPVPVANVSQSMIINGTSFVSGSKVILSASSKVNTIQVTWAIDSNQMRITPIIATTGPWTVQIVNPDGQQSNTFSFIAIPVVNTLAPTNATATTVATGQTLTLEQEVGTGELSAALAIKEKGYTKKNTNAYPQALAVWTQLLPVVEAVEKSTYGRDFSWAKYGGWQLSVVDMGNAGKVYPTDSFPGGLIFLDYRSANLPDDQIAFLLAHEAYFAINDERQIKIEAPSGQDTRQDIVDSGFEVVGCVVGGAAGVVASGIVATPLGSIVAAGPGCAAGTELGNTAGQLVSAIASVVVNVSTTYLNNKLSAANQETADSFAASWLVASGFSYENAIQYLKNQTGSGLQNILQNVANSLVFSSLPSYQARLDALLKNYLPPAGSSVQNSTSNATVGVIGRAVSAPATTNSSSSSIQAQINALMQQIALLQQEQNQQNTVAANSSTTVSSNPVTHNTTQSQPSICIPSWNCDTWSACVNGQQTRTCTDLLCYGLTTGKPSQAQSCSASNSVQAPTVPSVPAPFSTLTSDFGGIEYGTGTTLRWSSSNTTSCTASGGWSGTKALSGSQDTGPLYSSQTYILNCTGPGGSVSQQASVSVSNPAPTVTASPSAPAPTLTFTTSLPWVMYGQDTTLQWSSSNAVSCTASGSWSGNEPLSGSKDTGPLSSTETFILTCTGPGGSVSRNTSVGIKNAPTLAIVDSYAATQGKPFNLTGSNFTPSGRVTLHFAKPDGSFYSDQHTQADSYGKLSFSWSVPSNATPGNSSVSASDDTSGLQTSSIGFKIIATAQISGDLTLSVSPISGPPGTVFTVSGTNFTPNSAVIIRFVKADNNQYPPQQPAADANGNLNFNWNGSAGAASGIVSVWALDNGTGRSSPTASIQITAQ